MIPTHALVVQTLSAYTTNRELGAKTFLVVPTTGRLSWYVMKCHDKSWNDPIWFREVFLCSHN